MSAARTRVLMLSWEFPPRIVGGIARHVDEISRALARNGVDVDVLTAHHPGAPSFEVIAAGAGCVRVMRAAANPVNPIDFISDIHQLNFLLLERLLAEGGAEYDLLHAHDWLVAFAARTLKHGRHIPLVGTIHATEAGRNRGIHNPMQSYIHSQEWLLTYDAWRVICCSDAMASEVFESLQTPLDKVRVVPNGVDPSRLRCTDTADQLAAFRRRWAAPEERIILFVGRLVREKGVEVLVDSMPEVVATHPEAKFIVAGGGYADHLRARAGSLGLGHKVVFTGFVPEVDLPRSYAVADVAVFPSLYEPFGIVELEAMAAGVPVITSDVGGFREVVRHGETGLHTWANNPRSLAWGINEVLSNLTLAARLRREGLKAVRTRYNWDGIARATISVYQEVLVEREAAAERRAMPLSGTSVHPRYMVSAEAASRS
ncbi:MAG: glycosyltransferase family 4 protein [Armatimonadota bacterium]